MVLALIIAAVAAEPEVSVAAGHRWVLGRQVAGEPLWVDAAEARVAVRGERSAFGLRVGGAVHHFAPWFWFFSLDADRPHIAGSVFTGEVAVFLQEQRTLGRVELQAGGGLGVAGLWMPVDDPASDLARRSAAPVLQLSVDLAPKPAAAARPFLRVAGTLTFTQAGAWGDVGLSAGCTVGKAPAGP